MAKDYFDKARFSNLVKLINVNPIQAKEGFELYLSEYEDDYYAFCMYAAVLIRLQKFSEAEKILVDIDKLLVKYPSDKSVIRRENVFYNMIAVLCYTERYEEVFSYINNNQDLCSTFKGLEKVILYCQKKLGLLNSVRSATNSYIINQIIEYSEQDMFEHIKKHLMLSEIYDNSCVFCENFPIKLVIEEVKKRLFFDKRICFGIYDDSYFFKYDYCGRVDKTISDYFRVVCFHNTSDIITIYPQSNCEHLPYVDLNYLNQQSCTPSISMREKFNKRYRRS